MFEEDVPVRILHPAERFFSPSSSLLNRGANVGKEMSLFSDNEGGLLSPPIPCMVIRCRCSAYLMVVKDVVTVFALKRCIYTSIYREKKSLARGRTY